MKIWPMFALCAVLNGAALGIDISKDEKSAGDMMLHGGLTLLWGSLASRRYREDKEADAIKRANKTQKKDDRFDIM